MQADSNISNDSCF